MPIYEYRCDACGAQKEHLQKMNSALLTTCPSCGHDGYRKLLSAAGFQLKGSGWYATDFKGSGAAPAAKPGNAAETPKTPATDSGSTTSTSTSSAACGGGCACH